MTDTSRRDPMFSDDDILELARSVQSNDFDRIAPPSLVWENIAADLEEEVAASEATARRKTSRWFQSTQVLAIAAATLLMVGVAAAVVFSQPDESSGEQLAAAVMTDADLPVATTETATARVVCDGDECAVDVSLTGLPDAGDGDLELWVINGDVTDMHSLGLVTESGSYPLPAGVTPDDFPIVDISVEPRDGVEAHSGQSVLRGVFQQA